MRNCCIDKEAGYALNVLDPGEVAVSNLLKRDKTSTEQRRHDVGQRLLLIAKWKQEAGLEPAKPSKTCS